MSQRIQTAELKAKMHIIFRVDASTEMGSGHVMRCLTLADAITKKGAQCYFISRQHPGNMLGFIQSKGYHAVALLAPEVNWQPLANESKSKYAAWLGVSLTDDAAQTQLAIKSLCLGSKADWLVVDHYALDEYWESRLRSYCQEIMVIDDLADRKHDCNLLLDQTFGRDEQDYRLLTPEHCTTLTGSQYALLRPEFAEWRQYSLKRRSQPELKHLLITLGGVDKDNITGQVLEALKSSSLPDDCFITVVMGANAPWLEAVQKQAETLKWHIEVKVNVWNMAQLMADSDLCIGAAGGTTWERCCLGLPTIMLILAGNQKKITKELSKNQTVYALSKTQDITHFIYHLTQNINQVGQLIIKSSLICDGLGLERTMSFIR
jgi:UDP-2,4-diacetamido-2,4,6-trideoxy-beta-L-altropyranose hydrolase